MGNRGLRFPSPDRALLMAELGQAHEGSIGIAHSMIDEISRASFDAVKFQVHHAEAESTLDEVFRPGTRLPDANRLDYWNRTAFNDSEWSELFSHARELGLSVVASTFSVQGIETLAELGIDAWKIGSGEALQPWFIAEIAAMGQPTFLSTGMSTWAEIELGIQILSGKSPVIGLLQCTSKYPVSLREIGIQLIDEIRDKFGLPTGLSDHSGSKIPPMVALARGASVLEVHATFSRRMFGPDSSSSLTFEELREISEFRDAFWQLRRGVNDKDATALELEPTRKIFGRSLAPRRKIRAGEILTSNDLIPKKPSGGIPWEKIDDVVGVKTRRELDPSRIIRWEDLEL